MPDLSKELERLNFSVNEARVYLALLQLGPSLAGSVAKEARLDRSSTYNALKMLIERGIVSTVHENKRTTFVPADPKKIIDYYKEKEELAGTIIPKLKELYAFKKEKKNVSLFQGYKGLKTIFQDMLDSGGKEHYVMGSEGQFSQRMPYYAPLFSRLKQERGIRSKVLIREGRTKMSRGKTTEYREVPSDVVSPATINVYEGKVAIVIWDEKPEAVLIENARVSETFRNYFKFIWKHAKTPKN